MKKARLIILAICATFCAVTIPAQSITITPEKVTYKRTGKVAAYKKTFEVKYPRISGVSDPTVKQNLSDTINNWKVFGTTLQEKNSVLAWLTSLDYKVNYNKNGLLSIAMYMEGSGAYPSTNTKKLVADLKTGKRVYIPDVFTNIPKLLIKIDKAQKREIAKEKRELKSQGENPAELDQLIRSYKYSGSKIEEFSVNDSGVVFYYDYGFAHAVKALEPDGRYMFSWRDLKGHIKPDGLLAKFIN